MQLALQVRHSLKLKLEDIFMGLRIFYRHLLQSTVSSTIISLFILLNKMALVSFSLPDEEPYGREEGELA